MTILTGDEICRLQRRGETEQNPRNYIQVNKFDNGPSKASIFQRSKPEDVVSTEISNEIGTTDQYFGEPSLEDMIMTTGKIPNEMFDLENTPPEPEAISGLETNSSAVTQLSTSKEIVNIKELSVSEPSVLFIIGIILGILLLFGCIIACAISRVKKKNYKQLKKNDVECNTSGRPLLSPCKRKESSTTTTYCRN